MTTYTITSKAQLQTIMRQLGNDVIRAVSEELLNIFKEDFVQRYVYDGHSPNEIYEPTGEFKDAWEFTKIESQLNELATTLWYNWMKMEHFGDRETFAHTSAVPDWPQDTRKYLDDWLNRTVSSGHFFSPIRSNRYWQEFIQKMVKEGGIDKLFKKHFAKYGINS